MILVEVKDGDEIVNGFEGGATVEVVYIPETVAPPEGAVSSAQLMRKGDIVLKLWTEEIFLGTKGAVVTRS